MLLQDALSHPWALCLWKILCGISAPRKGHIHLLFAMRSWCYFPWYRQSFGLVLHGTSLGWWDLPPLFFASLDPGAICSWLGWVCWGLLQMWGFGSGTARIVVLYGTEPASSQSWGKGTSISPWRSGQG